MEEIRNFNIEKNKFYLENIDSTTELTIIQNLVENKKINLNDSTTLAYLFALILKQKKTTSNNINLLFYLLKNITEENEKVLKDFVFQSCELGKEKILKLVLDNNFNINSQNELGETLLHIAISKSDIKIINLLLQYSPNQNIKTYKDNLSVFDYAFEQENSFIISLLKKGENKKINLITIEFNDKNNEIIAKFQSQKNDIIEDSISYYNYKKSRNVKKNNNELFYFETQSDEDNFSEQLNSIEIKLNNQLKTKEEQTKIITLNKNNKNENYEDEENEEIFNEETGNINQRMSNFSSFEDNLSLFHHKFSINGLKEKEKKKILNTYRKTTNTNFIENSTYNKIINTEESNKNNKTNKHLTRELSTNLPSLIVPLKNENENDFLTEQSLFYNNVYSIEKKQQKNLEQFINFFNEIGLNTEYTKILSTNGFDDLNLLIEQTKNGIAMTDENLKEIGIKKPGIRAKIIIHLEELSKLFDFPIEKEKVYFKNDRNKNYLFRFLSSINLEFYLNNFIDNEYTSPELLFVQMKCKQPITEDFLFKEIGIDKIGYRMRILNKIKNESCNYFYKLKNGILGKNKVFGENNTIFFEKKNDGINSNNDFCNMCSIV